MAVKKEQKDVQVIKKKPRGGNSPVIGDNGLMLEAGDNTKIMSINIAPVSYTHLEGDTIPDNIYNLSVSLEIKQDILWKLVNELERKVAKRRGLV